MFIILLGNVNFLSKAGQKKIKVQSPNIALIFRSAGLYFSITVTVHPKFYK